MRIGNNLTLLVIETRTGLSCRYPVSEFERQWEERKQVVAITFPCIGLHQTGSFLQNSTVVCQGECHQFRDRSVRIFSFYPVINAKLQLPGIQFAVNRQGGDQPLLQMTSFMDDQGFDAQIIEWCFIGVITGIQTDTAEDSPKCADTGARLFETDPRLARAQKFYCSAALLSQVCHGLQKGFLPNLMFHVDLSLQTNLSEFCKYKSFEKIMS